MRQSTSDSGRASSVNKFLRMNKLQIYVHGENNRDPKLVKVAEKASVNEIISKYQQEFFVPGSADDIILVLKTRMSLKRKEEGAKQTVSNSVFTSTAIGAIKLPAL